MHVTFREAQGTPGGQKHAHGQFLLSFGSRTVGDIVVRDPTHEPLLMAVPGPRPTTRETDTAAN